MEHMSGEKAGGDEVLFDGSYETYLRFTQYIDTTPYIREDSIIMTEHPAEEIGSRIEGSYAEKKEWPYW
jgi:hypothetical protein